MRWNWLDWDAGDSVRYEWRVVLEKGVCGMGTLVFLSIIFINSKECNKFNSNENCRI